MLNARSIVGLIAALLCSLATEAYAADALSRNGVVLEIFPNGVPMTLTWEPKMVPSPGCGGKPLAADIPGCRMVQDGWTRTGEAPALAPGLLADFVRGIPADVAEGDRYDGQNFSNPPAPQPAAPAKSRKELARSRP